MKQTIFWAIGLLLAGSIHAQSGFPKYYAYVALCQQGDSLYQAGRYKDAATAYHQAAKAEIEMGFDLPRAEVLFNAACCHVLSGDAKNAFLCLESMAGEHHYMDVERLQSDADLTDLHHDKRWASVLAAVQANKDLEDRRQAIYRQRTTLATDNEAVVFYPHPGSLVVDLLNRDTLPFVSVSHGPYRLYFSADSYAASQLEAIQQTITTAYYRAINLLGIDRYQRGISLVLFNSVEEMKQATGVRAQGGIAYPELDAGLFPITPLRRPQFKHEIFHILSLNAWGPCFSRLLIEGSAVYADNECHYDNPIYAYNAYLVQHEKALPLSSLLHDFDQIAVQNDVIAYLQSAGVFKYLYEKYGIEKMKALWKTGFDAFEGIYGFPVEQLEKDWLEHMRTVPLPSDFDFDRFAQGCG